VIMRPWRQNVAEGLGARQASEWSAGKGPDRAAAGEPEILRDTLLQSAEAMVWRQSG
jgi:hypothetical protein